MLNRGNEFPVFTRIVPSLPFWTFNFGILKNDENKFKFDKLTEI